MRFSRLSLLALFAGMAMAVFLSGCGTKRISSSKDRYQKTQVPSKVKVDASMAQPTKALLCEADTWLGTSYKYGGTDRRGVDCSALVMNVYNTALGIKLPRNSAKQQEYCSNVNRNKLTPGDLVFFSNASGKVNHVGMYIGSGNIIHASSSRGVIISSLSDSYYRKNYHSAGRVDKYFAMLRKAARPDVADPDLISPLPAPEEYQASAQPRRSAPRAVAEVHISELSSVKFSSASPAPVTAAVIDEARRKVLDEVVEQKVDSILISFFE